VALTTHPDVDMVSFTGSTRAGIQIAKNAADTVKRVHQELGGKSPNLVLEDADFAANLPGTLQGVVANTGQSCIAPTRLLVPTATQGRSRSFRSRLFRRSQSRQPRRGRRAYRPGRQQGAVVQGAGSDRKVDRGRRKLLKAALACPTASIAAISSVRLSFPT
jgi:acyl-CoA reductase-like NAD-dependent aldehyde dehydrogenase